MTAPRVVDSITELGPGDAGCVAVSGSHGGISSARYALAARPRLSVFNDAGVGKDEAGIAALAFLQARGLAACTVEHASARRLKEAADAAREGLARFRDTPGFHAVRCEVELRRSNPGAAKRSCDAALAKFDEMPWVHYLAAFTTRQHATAARHLERAIELDPDAEQAWRELADRYRQNRKNNDLAGLRSRYRAHFGRDLPGQGPR